LSIADASLEQTQDIVLEQMSTAKEILYDWWGLNLELFKFINGIRGPFYDILMLNINHLAEARNFSFLMVLLLIFILGSAVARKSLGKGGSRQYFIAWFATFMVLISSFVITNKILFTMKDSFRYPRPYVVLDHSEINMLESTRDRKNAYRSFPSGHVQYMTMLVASLWPMLNLHFRILGGLMIFGAAWARISLGMHFPADTVWSFLITACIVVLIRAIVFGVMRNFLKLSV
jgi:membrane-associated phospholipid phosphatase